MADNNEHHVVAPEEEDPSLMDKITDKFHHPHHAEASPAAADSSSSSSSSDSDSEHQKHAPAPSPAPATEASSSSAKDKVNRLFGRQKPVHQVLGGGKPADVLLWRNKKVSASVLGTATVIWVLFELLEYHLLTLISYILIFSLAILFLWGNASRFINKSPPRIPEVILPQETIVDFVSAVRFQINLGLHLLREIALGRELKKFLAVIAGLWVLSILGSCCNFLTLFYIIFVVLHTVPLLYEKYEDKVDPFAERAATEAKNFAERAATEAKKKYSLVNEKYLSKLPKVPLNKKAA